MMNKQYIGLCLLVLCGCRTIPVEPGVRSHTFQKPGQEITEYSRDGVRILHISKHPNQDPDKTITRQVVFHKGERVLDIVDIQGRRSFSVEPNIPVSVGATLDENGQTADVILMDPHHVLVDSFTVEDTLLVPVSNEELARVRSLTIELNNLFDPDKVKRQTPDEFAAEALGIANKHRITEE